jgi:polyphosphate kinase 2 (PPK2 family)
MKIHTKDFRVPERDEVDLGKWPTTVDPVYKSKKQYHKMLKDHVAQLSSQQQLLYASNRYAVLLIFQAMDAAGKDGSIKHVMSGVNPQGCQVFSYKHPSPAESRPHRRAGKELEIQPCRYRGAEILERLHEGL